MCKSLQMWHFAPSVGWQSVKGVFAHLEKYEFIGPKLDFKHNNEAEESSITLE